MLENIYTHITSHLEYTVQQQRQEKTLPQKPAGRRKKTNKQKPVSALHVRPSLSLTRGGWERNSMFITMGVLWVS